MLHETAASEEGRIIIYSREILPQEGDGVQGFFKARNESYRNLQDQFIQVTSGQRP